MQLPLSFFERLPKTDLHVHLDGSLRIETILELASEQGVKLPAETREGLLGAMNCGVRTGSLVEYLKAFDITLRVLQTEESLVRVAYELCEDAAKENVRYMEIRYAPMLHTQKGLRLTTVVEAVLSGIARARKELGIHAKVIICGI
ncbi:MAG TPA: adenosine deaminase, partial [Polyangiales bacterium]|nr:adenosine deaminase [Polyangiales bacterium]